MKNLILCFVLVVAALAAFAACFDYSPTTQKHEGADAEATPQWWDAGAPPQPWTSGMNADDAAVADAGAPEAAPAPNPCASLSYRGATPGGVVCPGADGCECGGGDICCMDKVDSVAGACGALGACRTIAIQCDGPEDCGDGGVCCLEDRSGGGASCKSTTSCSSGGEWLCRRDDDCNNAPAGPRCAPLDLGAAGVDDVGLDGIIGICGK